MTVFVLGSSGVAQKIDIPADPHAAERFHASVASGEFRIVDESEVESTTTRHGGVIYVLKTASDDSTKPAPRKRAASKKAAEQVTPQAETDGTPEANAEEDAPEADADESPAGDEQTD